MGQYTEEPLHVDPNLPAGWHRKVVQRQTGATAGQWDVYVFNPEGKKFRSRNELRNYFEETNSSYNYEDFDFSVKGKGHTTKGKTPSKKSGETVTRSSSKENSTPIRSSSRPRTKRVAPPPPPPTPASTKRKSSPTKASNTPSSVRPRRKPEPDESPLLEDEELTEEEISNVKLKVKVGYTATGAMIRPPANGGAPRKKKLRFRNMKVKKSQTSSSSSSITATTTPAISLSPIEADALTIKSQEEKKNKAAALTTKKKAAGRRRKNGRTVNNKTTATEPVAGPSGLQKVKRSPRRILNRNSTSNLGAPTELLTRSEDDDDEEEDEDYFDVLYPTTTPTTTTIGTETSTGSDPLKTVAIEEASRRQSNGLAIIRPSRSRQRPPLENENHSELLSCVGGGGSGGGGSGTSTSSGPPVVVEAVPFLTESQNEDQVGPMMLVVEDEQHQHKSSADTLEDVCNGGEQLTVVVIGDSVEDLHNYAKPHAV